MSETVYWVFRVLHSELQEPRSRVAGATLTRTLGNGENTVSPFPAFPLALHATKRLENVEKGLYYLT